MHFVISWDISAQGTEWTDLNDKMRAILKPYSWARPLTTFYVVNVPSQETWNKILAELSTFAKGHPNKINFIMSPLMQGGKYNGILPNNMWDEINKRSV